MCCGCSPTAQKVWSFGCGIVVLALSITIGVLWPTISLSLINKELQLTEYSTNYQKWIKSPFPLYMEFYFFNWTNWEEFNVEGDPNSINNGWKKGVKPKFEEVGPYVFEEIHERVKLNYTNDDEELAFNQIKTWWFRPDLSKGKLTDKIVNLNPISTSLNYMARYQTPENKKLADALLTQMTQMFTTATVNEWIFEGFQDGILDWFLGLIESGEIVLPPDFPEIPFEKFGFFALRNGSSDYDGRLQIYTGKDDIDKLGMFKSWKGMDTLGMMKGECDKIHGTTGEVWPPFDTKAKNKPDATMFITDICRSLTLKYDSKFERHGIKGWKWIGDDSLFDNGHKYPETACYCLADEKDCAKIKPGIFNTSKCQFGSPSFASYPHFYLADESYLKDIEGLEPDKEKHEMYIALEPNFGLPLEIRARLQINMFLRNDPDLKYYKDVTDMYVPYFWFTQIADLPEDLADESKMIFLVQDVGMWICYVLAAIGSLCVIMGLIFTFTKCGRSPEPSTVFVMKTS